MICNGTSRRHVSAVAQGVVEALRDAGARPIGVEGMNAQRWVLADFGDVMLHVFDPDMRGFYDLESIWVDAPRLNPAQPAAPASSAAA